MVGTFWKGGWHSAPFDADVLRATCAWYGVEVPDMQFECTVRVAGASWGLRPTTLRHVADHLGLSVQHHDAGSDAEACASIVLAAAG